MGYTFCMDYDYQEHIPGVSPICYMGFEDKYSTTTTWYGAIIEAALVGGVCKTNIRLRDSHILETA